MLKINLIDIGAVGGFEIPWNLHREKIGRSLRFEPNELPVLTGNNLLYDTAIWNFDGEGTFYVSGKYGTGSSLLKQNFNWVRENFEEIKNNGDRQINNSWFERSQITQEFQCPVKKLDTILEELYLVTDEHIPFHFLKSDTQSGEFFVLQGAKKYLEEDCIGLELELFRYPLYEGLVIEDQVKTYLKDLGFCIAGWTGYQNSFNSQADYLFLRETPRSREEAKIIDLILKIYQPKGLEKIIKKESVSHPFIDRFNRLLSKMQAKS
jgi:FkbM family methyltransferase